MGASPSTFRTYSAAESLRLSLRLATLCKLGVKELDHLYNHPFGENISCHFLTTLFHRIYSDLAVPEFVRSA